MATKSIFILDCLLALKAELHKTDATRLSHSSPIGGGGRQKDEKGKERESSFFFSTSLQVHSESCVSM